MDTNLYDKIKKLLAHTEGRIANENEMQNALSLAMRILAKHNLTIDDFRNYEKSESKVGVEVIAGGKNKNISNWKAQLAVQVCRANFCYVYRGGPYLVVVGKEENRQSALAMLEYLYFIIEETAKAAFKRYNGHEHGKTFINNYKMGMVLAINHRLRKEMDVINTEMNSTDLVKLDMYDQNESLLLRWLADGGVVLEKSVQYKTNANSEALNLGIVAGRDVSLRPCDALAA